MVAFTKIPLSLVVITLNEVQNIAKCIESVPFASEVIVVDSLSQDNTCEIAERLGARVVSQKFLGYREQKQFALEHAIQPWVLSLDADEYLSENLKSEIFSFIENWVKTPTLNKFSGFKIPRCSFHLGRWIRHGGWYPDFQTRLFLRDKGSWIGGAVHESLRVEGPVGKLKSDLHHNVFKDLSDQIETNNEFSTLGAKALLVKKSHFSVLKLVFKPVGKFFECYIWKMGILDGVPGFVIALGAAQSIFFKYAKLWELEKQTNV